VRGIPKKIESSLKKEKYVFVYYYDYLHISAPALENAMSRENAQNDRREDTYVKKIEGWLRERSDEDVRLLCCALLDEASERGKAFARHKPFSLIEWIYCKTGHLPNVSRDKILELIADISWELRRRDFDVEGYMKNVFKGRQKGRATRTFS
jgi:intein/homing endonuclease